VSYWSEDTRQTMTKGVCQVSLTWYSVTDDAFTFPSATVVGDTCPAYCQMFFFFAKCLGNTQRMCNISQVSTKEHSQTCLFCRVPLDADYFSLNSAQFLYCRVPDKLHLVNWVALGIEVISSSVFSFLNGSNHFS
jgi:hypothetical protein